MISRLPVWQVVVLAGIIGAIAAFGQAPYDLPLLMLAGIAAVVWVYNRTDTPRAAALIGWGFGTGYFMHALQWIVSPFMVDVARHGWMAPFALVFLSAGLAIIWAVAFWGARKLSPHRAWPLVLCWPAAELVRAHIFTGFPWAMSSQVLVGGIAGQALAWVGSYALNMVLVGIAVALVHRGPPSIRIVQGILVVGSVAAMLTPPGALPLAGAERPTIRLIQPNAAQRDKWDPAKIPIFYDRQLALSASEPRTAAQAPTL